MWDPNAEVKAFPEVCGETPPATFQFIPATGALGTVPPVTRFAWVTDKYCTGSDESCCTSQYLLLKHACAFCNAVSRP